MKMTLLLAGTALTAVLLTAQEPAQTQTFEQRVVVTRAEGQGPIGSPITADFLYMSTDMNPLGPAVKNAPYTADAVSETLQVLPDGNRITHQTTSQLARDSQGRTMRRDKLGAVGPVTASNPAEITFINDPVANVSWVLESQTKTARKRTVVVNQSGGAASATVGGGVMGGIISSRPAQAVVEERTTNSDSGMQQFVKFSKVQQAGKAEQLGKRVIEGVECVGSKSTLTIPAGQIGNERAIEVVSERWYSPELQTVVYSKRNDPRMGETTYKLTNIQRSEPSRLIFEIPADYTVKDSQMMIGVKAKKDE